MLEMHVSSYQQGIKAKDDRKIIILLERLPYVCYFAYLVLNCLKKFYILSIQDARLKSHTKY
jgi:hypothetical protein